jgi:hypothetical protein
MQAATAHYHQAVAHEQAGDPSGAAALYRQALAAFPAFPDACRNLAWLLGAEGHTAAAIAYVRRALALAPDTPLLLGRLGDLQRLTGRLVEATAALNRAVELDPTAWEAWYYHGLLRAEQGDDAGAITSFDRGLATAPADTPLRHAMRWHRAMALLAAGDYAAGFAEAEVRIALPRNQRRFPMPVWQGESLAGRSILIWSDQGFGDTIQFVRFLPALGAMGARVLLAADAALLPLLRGFPGVGTLLPLDTTAPADVHLPLMSLPYRLGTTLATLPPPPAYYLPAPRRGVPLVLRPSGTGLAVGIAWAGESRHPTDQRRSATLDAFLALADLPGVSLFSLQVGPRAGDIDAVGAAGLVHRLTRAPVDFADTAAALGDLDLVVAVDTSVAHLAGTLGRPGFVVLPHAADWRWLRDRSDSPWYPTLRLFRQPAPGDWDGALAAVRGAIAERLA